MKTIWKLDPTHSEITFKVKHLMISNVKGAFNSFDVTLEGDSFEDAVIKAVIDASSIDTGNDDRDNHLKSGDFFDVESFKSLTFVSSSFDKVNDSEYRLRGMLEIKGINKEVSLDVEFGGITKDPWGNEKAGFSVEGKINRKDWGLNWNTVLESGGVLVGEEIKIQAEIQLAGSAS